METVEEPDPTVVSTVSESETFLCQQYVVFSSTFRVPAFYFLVCNQSGAPLPLPDVLRTSLFKTNACENVEISSYALTLPTSTFPLLSHGDHPTLGTSCWYFHPCETSTVIEELMREVKVDDWDESAKLVRWLELWFMVVSSVVNL
ncbi:Ubiquitin-like-conjugating enzyme ATG10 [Leucoagaricus sp. SymC.cos]|nr:Ubiquitin-like-conjugating enzyme ATG10 [Leucoagaricus sp. SymC.cos]